MADHTEDQKMILEEDTTTEFRNVLHPIRQIPVETLRHIFTDILALPNDGSNFQQATQLSHVCSYWRAVALSDPFLWTEIAVDMCRPRIRISRYWNRAVERVKNAPARVTFYNVGGYRKRGKVHKDKQQQKFATCNLSQIPVISTLEFHVMPGYPNAEAFETITELPSGSLELLKINGESMEKDGDDISWDLNKFLHQFPSSKTLVLSYLGEIEFIQPTPFPGLRNLQLAPCIQLDLLTLLPLCPVLERLTIGTCIASFYDSNLPPVTITTLTYLDIDGGHSFPWNAPISFPSLSTLAFTHDQHQLSEETIGFIARHPSILDLQVHVEVANVLRLASVAPQLTRLALWSDKSSLKPLVDWKSMPLNGPAFPNLKVLQVGVRGIKMTTFEKVVETRCLPATHAGSKLEDGCRPLERLIIPFNKPHLKSRFLLDATVREEKYGRDCVLSWL